MSKSKYYGLIRLDYITKRKAQGLLSLHLICGLKGGLLGNSQSVQCPGVGRRRQLTISQQLRVSQRVADHNLSLGEECSGTRESWSLLGRLQAMVWLGSWDARLRLVLIYCCLL